MTTQDKIGRGGRRAGAGRPAKPASEKYVRLDGMTVPPELTTWLREQRAQGETKSQTLVRLLERARQLDEVQS